MKNFRMAPALAVVALTLTASISASVHAQTFVSGHHDNNKLGDGYDALPALGPFIITPDAFFVNNTGEGFTTFGATNVTVNGGLFAGDLSGFSVTGNAVVNGGNFSHNIFYGIAAGDNTSIDIYGGLFGANSSEDILSGSFSSLITVYGTFDKYGALPVDSQGYFTGTLQNNSVPETIHYSNYGRIILAPAAVPEASTLMCFGLLLTLGVGGSAVWKRRQLAG